MEDPWFLRTKAVLALLASVLVVVHARRRGARARAGLAAMAVLSLVAYVNFFQFSGSGHLHRWEAFHYVLGSKYFPELGYDGIYAASVAAQFESDPDLAFPRRARDLRSGRLVPTQAVLAHGGRVRERFSAPRWASFVQDNRYFVTHCSPAYLGQIRRDHGYNPSPAWAVLPRVLTRFLPVNDVGLTALAAVDLLLLLGVLLVFQRTFGTAAAASSAMVFGLGYLNHYGWIGGAVLRLDWLFCVGCGVSALARSRFALAGALFGAAGALRVFPILFLIGPLIWAVFEFGARRRARPLLALLAGATAALVIMGALGAMTGRGVQGWIQFAERIHEHRAGWLNNNVGLRQCVDDFFYLARQPVAEWGEYVRSDAWVRRNPDLARGPSWAHLLVAVPVLALVARAARRATPSGAGVLGLVVVFALTEPTCYYWSMLLLVPLVCGARPVVALLLVNGAFSLLAVATNGGGQAPAVFRTASWILLVYFVALLTRWRQSAPVEAEPRGATPAA